jgi:hypothetical protein
MYTSPCGTCGCGPCACENEPQSPSYNVWEELLSLLRQEIYRLHNAKNHAEIELHMARLEINGLEMRVNDYQDIIIRKIIRPTLAQEGEDA